MAVPESHKMTTAHSAWQNLVVLPLHVSTQVFLCNASYCLGLQRLRVPAGAVAARQDLRRSLVTQGSPAQGGFPSPDALACMFHLFPQLRSVSSHVPKVASELAELHYTQSAVSSCCLSAPGYSQAAKLITCA